MNFQYFLLAFIPIFVAVDPVGILPIFVALTQDLNIQEKRKVIGRSIVAALIMATFFVVLGKAVFRFMGITEADFMIAGGLVLFCIALIDLLQPEKVRRVPGEDFGIVPIAIPLIVGPGVLTTSLILHDQFGLLVTLSAVFLNILLVGAVFIWADMLTKILGLAGTRALSKVMALFLGAIAIMMVRKGILLIIQSAIQG